MADPLPAADPVPPRRRRRRRADAAARRGDPAPQALRPPVIGVALGSGSARGWAHIGVLDGLLREGVTPTVVAGASAGAIVGAFYAAGRLDEFESWVRALTRLKVVRLGDFRMGAVVWSPATGWHRCCARLLAIPGSKACRCRSVPSPPIWQVVRRSG
ncbi:patatin-like phospholipase family protein [Tistrella bauzanensis]